MIRRGQPTCPMCAEHGIHATVDQCLAALRVAQRAWQVRVLPPDVEVLPVPVWAVVRPRLGAPRRCTGAQIAEMRTLCRTHSTPAVARLVGQKVSTVQNAVAGRLKARDEARAA
jgi:hypothetical protein